jgi:hypothetical protein
MKDHYNQGGQKSLIANIQPKQRSSNHNLFQ